MTMTINETTARELLERHTTNGLDDILKFLLDSISSSALTLPLPQGSVYLGAEVITIEYYPNNVIIEDLILKLKEPPVGSDLIIDIKINDISIFEVGQELVVEANKTSSLETTLPNKYSLLVSPTIINEGDRFSVDVIQVGATNPGLNAQLTIKQKSAS